jgi:glycine/D-amino acid oxidase-like deaminating enzyme/nitrite reductase/ring-hydroxylating ferredoxin subunit
MSAAHPVWQPVPDDPAFRSPPPSSADVCVVGAGIAGLTVAYQLARAGRRVAVLEAQSVGAGMTSHTTAHLSDVIDDRFTHVIDVRGEEIARLGAGAHAAAIDFIEQAAAREQIDCGFERLDGYLVQASEQDAKIINQENDAARKLGVAVQIFPEFPAPGYRGSRCLRFPRQGRMRPVAYITGLAQAIVRHGGTISSGARVESVEDGGACRVTVRGGRELVASAVVVATNSPVIDRFRLQTKMYPYMTYVVGLSVPADGVPDALIWDTLDPYHYVRRAGMVGPDGRDTLIVGGEDHKTGQAHDGAERLRRLEAWARDHVPVAGERTCQWAGQVLETLDGFAYIGRNPGDENVYVVAGDSGMGITHGTIAGILVPALIAGEKHPWAEVFDPGRAPVRSVKEFASENANVALQYADWLTPGEVKSADEVKPGSGAVVRSGLTKHAVYREPDGQLVTCSAVCAHLKAIVQWNDVTKTWDCPAHGSRYNCRGEVIEGPANANLERVRSE